MERLIFLNFFFMPPHNSTLHLNPMTGFEVNLGGYGNVYVLI